MNVKTEIESKFAEISVQHYVKLEIARKMPGRNACLCYVRAKAPFSNVALAELRATDGRKGALLDALKAKYSTVQLKWGGGEDIACFVLG